MTEYRITQQLANPERSYLLGPVVASSAAESLLRTFSSYPYLVTVPCIIEVLDASKRVCARVTIEHLEPQPEPVDAKEQWAIASVHRARARIEKEPGK